MIVDRERFRIFLHNPKTGGTFFRKVVNLQVNGVDGNEFFIPYTCETNTDLGHINKNNLARFVKNSEYYNVYSIVRNPYDRFISTFNRSVFNHPKIKKLWEESGSVENFIRYIHQLNYRGQDSFIRNPEIPWLNPQSYCFGGNIKSFQYESEADWTMLFKIFGVESANSVVIKPHYDINHEILRILKDLYWDDAELFKLYGL